MDATSVFRDGGNYVCNHILQHDLENVNNVSHVIQVANVAGINF